jgi:hypothetical protein
VTLSNHQIDANLYAVEDTCTVFRPNEVKTLRLPSSAETTPSEVDLIEWDPAQPPPMAGS